MESKIMKKETMSPIAVNDAVAIPRRDTDDDPDQEVFMGRVIALTDDGRVVAQRIDHQNDDMFMEHQRGQFPRIGSWELVEGQKRMFSGKDNPTWKFLPSCMTLPIAGLTALQAEDIDTLAEINAILGEMKNR